MLIETCPICGGELQATIEEYTSGVKLSASGNVVDYGKRCGGGLASARVYCNNDHTHSEMIEKIERANRRL